MENKFALESNMITARSNATKNAQAIYTNVGPFGVYVALKLTGRTDPCSQEMAINDAKDLLDHRSVPIIQGHRDEIDRAGYQDKIQKDVIVKGKRINLNCVGQYFPISKQADGGGRTAFLYHILCSDAPVGIDRVESDLSRAYLETFSSVSKPLDNRAEGLVKAFLRDLDTLATLAEDKRILDFRNAVSNQYASMSAPTSTKKIESLADAMLECSWLIKKVLKDPNEKNASIMNRFISNLENLSN